MLVVFFSVVVAVLTIAVKGQPAPPLPKTADGGPSNNSRSGQLTLAMIPDSPLEQKLVQILQNVRQAANRNVAILNGEISQVLNTVAIESGAWSLGKLLAPAERYNSILPALYEGRIRQYFRPRFTTICGFGPRS